VKRKTAGLLQTLSEYFLAYLPTVKGLSKNTVSSYQYAFRLLFEFLMTEYGIHPEQTTFEKLSGKVVTEYLNWLETSRKCSPITRNQRRAAIVSFAKYCVRKPFAETMRFSSEIMEIPKKKTAT
jgi:site-specific recombinase XerD